MPCNTVVSLMRMLESCFLMVGSESSAVALCGDIKLLDGQHQHSTDPVMEGYTILVCSNMPFCCTAHPLLASCIGLYDFL
jgi:hypothetical protein